jgi:hypothetical protein
MKKQDLSNFREKVKVKQIKSSYRKQLEIDNYNQFGFKDRAKMMFTRLFC